MGQDEGNAEQCLLFAAPEPAKYKPQRLTGTVME